MNFREITGVRLLVLFGSFFIGLIVASVIAMTLTQTAALSERTALLLASGAQCVVAFCLPAWVCARFISPETSHWLHLDVIPPMRSIIGVVIVYLLALPAMNQLIEWNEAIHFPDFMKGLEDTLRGWEEANGDVSEKIIGAKGVGAMLSGVAVVGLLTGFSEEMFFRGALQGVFSDSRVKTWVAVWGAALIFSALHFQFFGFVPRLLMGVFFGYLLVWSKSLWLPAFAHALNNSLVVVAYSMTDRATEGTGIDTFGITAEGSFPWAAIASAAATALLLWRFRNQLFKPNIH